MCSIIGATAANLLSLGVQLGIFVYKKCEGVLLKNQPLTSEGVLLSLIEMVSDLIVENACKFLVAGFVEVNKVNEIVFFEAVGKV